MHRKKRMVWPLLFVGLALLLAGCRQDAGETSAAESGAPLSVVSNRVPGSPSDPRNGGHPQSAAGSGPEAGAGSATTVTGTQSIPPQEEHSFTGTIVDEAMGTIYVQAEDGLTVGFSVLEADLSGLSEGRPGNPVTVYYTGTLQGDDTSNIKVLRFVTP